LRGDRGGGKGETHFEILPRRVREEGKKACVSKGCGFGEKRPVGFERSLWF